MLFRARNLASGNMSWNRRWHWHEIRRFRHPFWRFSTAKCSVAFALRLLCIQIDVGHSYSTPLSQDISVHTARKTCQEQEKQCLTALLAMADDMCKISRDHHLLSMKPLWKNWIFSVSTGAGFLPQQYGLGGTRSLKYVCWKNSRSFVSALVVWLENVVPPFEPPNCAHQEAPQKEIETWNMSEKSWVFSKLLWVETVSLEWWIFQHFQSKHPKQYTNSLEDKDCVDILPCPRSRCSICVAKVCTLLHSYFWMSTV